MLGLTLRKEFLGRRLKGTAIELANEKKTGATQIPAVEFLDITYPTHDVLRALEALSSADGRALVLKGERGLGKSHILACLHHAVMDTKATNDWLAVWSGRLKNSRILELKPPANMLVIGESLHRQQYRFLWDLLFERHPDGKWALGKWEGQGAKKTDVPPNSLIVEMLEKQPVTLLLDEAQTWFDGLTNTKQCPWKNWAFNFVQILSGVAKEHPDLLRLVVSVRSGTNELFQQIHRDNPQIVDFLGPQAANDRRRLLLHRLFENRPQVGTEEIARLVEPHLSEYLRLGNIPPADHERKRQEFVEMWPFAPHLLQLLEDQVLVAVAAQETRDLIKVLAALFKSRGDVVPLLTAADFRVDHDASGGVELLDSIVNSQQATLREKAQRNFAAVRDAVKQPETELPHLSEIVGSLWLRSLAVANFAGASPQMLQVDVTRHKPIDDNSFAVELSTIVDNSFNIHPLGDRLVFREDENAQTRVMSTARNDRLFTDGADLRRLAKEVRYMIGGAESAASYYKVVVLPQEWRTSPWEHVEEEDRPEQWDERLVYLIVPERPANPSEVLGVWLQRHLNRLRNAVRFVLPRAGSDTSIYADRDLVILTRAVMKAGEWKEQSPEYSGIQKKYQEELRKVIRPRFDTLAVLRRWSYTSPERSHFEIEGIRGQGAQLSDKVEESLKINYFVNEDFQALVLSAAKNNESVGKILRELREPRPNEEECIPWLGETEMKERLVRLCAAGLISINVRGTEVLQQNPGEDIESAWRRMRPKLGTGRHLDETYVSLPQAIAAASGPATFSLGSQHGNDSVGAQAPGVVAPGQGDGMSGSTGVTMPGAFTTREASAFLDCDCPATSALNLIGKIETWGIGPATRLESVCLRVPTATGAQLQKLLRVLPDGVTYELSLKKEQS